MGRGDPTQAGVFEVASRRLACALCKITSPDRRSRLLATSAAHRDAIDFARTVGGKFSDSTPTTSLLGGSLHWMVLPFCTGPKDLVLKISAGPREAFKHRF